MKVLSLKREVQRMRMGPVDPDVGFIGPDFEVDDPDNLRAARGLIFPMVICAVILIVGAGAALAYWF